MSAEMAKAAVLEHQRLSGGINWINSQRQLCISSH